MNQPNIGKKPHKFKYTYEDIAHITGLKLNTVRQYAGKGKKNKFNPKSFTNLFYYLYEFIEQDRITRGIIRPTQQHEKANLYPKNWIVTNVINP